MGKKIAILNPYRDYASLDRKDAVRSFISGADNIGNRVYINQVLKMIPGLDSITEDDIANDPDMIADSYESIILPLANMLSPFYKSGLPYLLERLPTRPILLSIGVQAPFGAKVSDIKLSDDALLLLKVATRDGSPVGARGEISSSILERYGFTNRIVGCPSLFGVRDIRAPDPSEICTNATLSGHHRELSADILAFAIAHAKAYFFQDESRMIADRYGIRADDLPSLDKESAYAAVTFQNVLFDYGYYNNGRHSWDEARAYFNAHAELHVDVDEWIAALRSYTLCIGTRMHGNVVSLLAGVPALYIPCDLRTKELIEFHGLPFLERVSHENDPAALAEATDYSEFYARLVKTRSAFLDFLGECDLAGINPDWVAPAKAISR